MSTVQDFEEGDIVRSMDPNFEFVYAGSGGTATLGKAAYNNSGDADLGTTSAPVGTKKISVMASLIDRETTNVCLLQRGYIVQTAGSGGLEVDQFVKPDDNGNPIAGVKDTDNDIYGIVIGKANTNNQTTREDVLAAELVIIKVGDY